MNVPLAHTAQFAKKQIAKFYEGGTVPSLVFVDWTSPTVPIEIEMIVSAPGIATKESITYSLRPDFSRRMFTAKWRE